MKRRIFAAALSFALYGSVVSHGMPFRTVALSGQPAPETPSGVLFSDFTHAVINQSGAVAFNAEVVGPGITPGQYGGGPGIWVTGANSVRKVARSSEQAVGFAMDILLRDQSNARIDDQGNVAFVASGLGLYSEGSGTLAPVLTLPVSSSSPAYSGSGKLAVRGRNTQSSRIDSIWTDVSGTMSQIIKTGDPAPGNPGYSMTDLYLPVINDANVVVFTGTMESPPRNFRLGMWKLENGVISPLAQPGQQVPGFSAGTLFNGIRVGDLATPFNPKINNSGQILFVSGITSPAGDLIGLLLDDQGEIRLVAQQGAQAPGMAPGVNLNSFEATRLNGVGSVAIFGTVGGPGVTLENNVALWTQRNGALTLVAREGEHAPGLPGGILFSELQQLNPDLTINASGQVAFRSSVKGNGVTVENDRGIWASDLGGVLKLIVREGDAFDVNSDPQITDFRTISEAALAINGSGGEEGAYTSLNDAGELAVTLNFTDGSAGVFVFSTALPEPSSLLMVGCVALGLPLIRNRLLSSRSSTGG